MVLRRVDSACAHNKDSSLATWGMTHVPIGNFVTKPYSMLHRVVIQNSGSQLLMSSPGVSLVFCKRKKTWVWRGLLRIGLRLPDTRFGWLLVGAFHGRLPAAAGNGRKLCHPRETSLCAPAKSGEAKFFFHALVFDEALDYGLVYIVFFR